MSSAQIATSQPSHLTKPKKFILVAEAMANQLPQELVHQILDDCTVFRVLHLVSCDKMIAYADIHPCKYHFPSASSLQTLRSLYILWYTVRSSLNRTLVPRTNTLARNVKTFSARYLGSSGPRILKSLGRDIKEILTSLSTFLVATFDQASEGAYRRDWFWLMAKPYSYQALCHRWELTADAQRIINQSRAAQLHKMAEIINRYSDLVKGFTDPSQQPRWNVQHTVSKLHQVAEQTSKEQWLNRAQKFRYFKYHRVPLVPFDWCLRLFIREVCASPQAQELRFPPNIDADIKTAIDGMAFVYTTTEPDVRDPPPSKVIRTKFTPWSAPDWLRPFPPIGACSGSSTKAQSSPGSIHDLPQDSRQQPPTPDAVAATGEQLASLLENAHIFDHWQPINHSLTDLPYVRRNTHRLNSRLSMLCYSTNSTSPNTPPNIPILPTPLTKTKIRAANEDKCWDPTHNHPIFTCPPGTHLPRELFAQKTVSEAVPTWMRLVMHGEREVEWLEAFCRCVRFFMLDV
ncbi:MAG: hypothetical protein LQ350_005260 [Teloschistes chrysophthalmus]|nr:MAG: hypothetical protein LQ350_005260 [Niorma chrysophthalma]